MSRTTASASDGSLHHLQSQGIEWQRSPRKDMDLQKPRMSLQVREHKICFNRSIKNVDAKFLTLFLPSRSNTSHYWRPAAHSWVYGQCLRSESEWRKPPLGRDSCHQYVFHLGVTRQMLYFDVWIYWAVSHLQWNQVAGPQFPVGCKVACPVLSTMHLIEDAGRNAVLPSHKMLRFWFSFTKPAESFGALFAFSQSAGKMCKDFLHWARWQRWLLLRDWGWAWKHFPPE